MNVHTQQQSDFQDLSQVWYVQESKPASWTADGVERTKVHGPSQAGPSLEWS